MPGDRPGAFQRFQLRGACDDQTAHQRIETVKQRTPPDGDHRST